VKSKFGARDPGKLILISPIVSSSKKPLVDLEYICLSLLDLYTYLFIVSYHWLSVFPLDAINPESEHFNLSIIQGVHWHDPSQKDMRDY